MNGGGRDGAPPSINGGEFLLSLLQQRPNHHHQQPPLPPQLTPQQQQQQQQEQQLLQKQKQQQQQQQYVAALVDPAVAAVGPTITNLPRFLSPNPTWHHHNPPPPAHLGFPYTNPIFTSQSQQVLLSDTDLQKLGLLSDGVGGNGSSTSNGNDSAVRNLIQQQLQQQQRMVQAERKMQFGSFSGFVEDGGVSRNLFNGLDRNHPKVDSVQDGRVGGGGGGGYYRPLVEARGGPPGFLNKPRGVGRGSGDYGSGRREFERNVDNERGHVEEFERNAINKEKGRIGEFLLNVNKEKDGFGEFERNVNNGKGDFGEFGRRNGDMKLRCGGGGHLEDLRLTEQLDCPGPPAGSNLHSVSGSKPEELAFREVGEDEKGDGGDDGELDDLGEELVDSLLLDVESDGKKDNKQNRHHRDKEYRSDKRGQQILNQRMRMVKAQIRCRRDIFRLDAHFLTLYESLIPPEEEKVKQNQLLALLEKLVKPEWPEARLYLYGSCANSFGVSKSDIDVCLAFQDANINKSEVLLKLADILQSDNLENVQALTRARVPIVKLMDPATGISCDICINNVLAVVNTKLLRDYAQIDVRLRQLAFIVKHWAKSRGVNETYQGTLSSYAYVLMCIHFLQQRRPAILPCLQGMEPTYSVTVDDIECVFFDKVENLHGYGYHNNETISQLVWAFFNYWAYRHDYTHDVISVRTGSIVSKQEKDWTRRVGNDRHLICIEDPFEVTHDLGRVVDKFSIRVLREEFERAAEIMQFDPNPCVTLFERYVPS